MRRPCFGDERFILPVIRLDSMIGHDLSTDLVFEPFLVLRNSRILFIVHGVEAGNDPGIPFRFRVDAPPDTPQGITSLNKVRVV